MERVGDVTGVLHAVLTCVTAGPGLGFNRAAIFLADERGSFLKAVRAVGAGSPEEAYETWARLQSHPTSLDELLRSASAASPRDSFHAMLEGVRVSLAREVGGNPIVDAFWDRQVVRAREPVELDRLPPDLRRIFGGTEVVCVPLVARDRCLGVLVADNAFSREPIDDARLQLLRVLALLAGLAIDNAGISQELQRKASELEKTLDDLRAAQDQLLHGERLATVGAVVARVSHEIRNPLTTIGGFARALVDHPDDAAYVKRNAAIIATEVEKLETLLKEMLDFTSPRPPALVPDDLNDLIDSLARLHRQELEDRGIELRLDLAPRLSRVRVDRDQLQRAFLNLWRNAVQAMEGIERTHRLEIRTAADGGGVTVTFADTGGGVPVSQREEIFMPFVTTKPRGSGLGLAVVKKVVDDHRGRVEIGGELGAGATFTIHLPAEKRS